MQMLTGTLAERPVHATAQTFGGIDRKLSLSDVAVAVTLFRPSRGQVERLVQAYAERFPIVFVFDNGGLSADTAGRLTEDPAIRLLSLGGNVGVAMALNLMAEAVRAEGFRYLLLLDQDSPATADIALSLKAATAKLALAGVRPAVVGPVPEPNADRKPPRYPQRRGWRALGSHEPVEFVATAGSLFDLDAFAQIGPFRDDYFIDGIDLEWCFRAWGAGYSCWLDRETSMAQQVGAGVIRSRLLPLAMPRQPLFRMATYLRNTIYGWRLPHVPWRWKLRQMLYLPLQAGLFWADSGYRPFVLRRLASAVLDGFRGQLGRPADAP